MGKQRVREVTPEVQRMAEIGKKWMEDEGPEGGIATIEKIVRRARKLEKEIAEAQWPGPGPVPANLLMLPY